MCAPVVPPTVASGHFEIVSNISPIVRLLIGGGREGGLLQTGQRRFGPAIRSGRPIYVVRQELEQFPSSTGTAPYSPVTSRGC